MQPTYIPITSASGTAWDAATNKPVDQALTANTSRLGIIEIADQTETNAGLNNTLAVTPKTLNDRVATETLTGIIEIATQAETNAGTDNVRAITAKKLNDTSLAIPEAVFVALADVTISSTIVETSILATGTNKVGSNVIAANTMQPGTTYEIEIGGLITKTNGNSNPILRLKLGSVIIAFNTSFTTGGATNLGFSAKFVLTCRTTGASGTVTGFGGFQAVTAQNLSQTMRPTSPAPTINTTIDQTIDITCQWASSADSLTISNLVIKKVKK